MSDDTGSKPQPCRFYQQAYPEVEECVVVQVERVDDVSAAVRLLEYNDIEGMILLSELSRRRIRSITKHIRVGNVEVLRVTRVDEEKGYVDLSKKRVNAAEAAEKNEYYQKSKSVHSLMFHVARTCLFRAAARWSSSDLTVSLRLCLQK
jgi:translation initiation factor 2 subunit 1